MVHFRQHFGFSHHQPMASWQKPHKGIKSSSSGGWHLWSKIKLATKMAHCFPYFWQLSRELTFSAPEKIDGWKTICLFFSNNPKWSLVWGKFVHFREGILQSCGPPSFHLKCCQMCFFFKGHQVIDLKMTQQNLHHQMLHGLFAYAGSGSIFSHLCLNVGDKIPTRSIWVIVTSITCQTKLSFLAKSDETDHSPRSETREK